MSWENVKTTVPDKYVFRCVGFSQYSGLYVGKSFLEIRDNIYLRSKMCTTENDRRKQDASRRLWDKPKWKTRPRGTWGFTPTAEGGGSLPGRVWSYDVTVLTVHLNQWRRYSSGPHLFKKGQAEVSTMGGARYRTNCLPGPREPFKRDTVYLAPGATEGGGEVFSQ